MGTTSTESQGDANAEPGAPARVLIVGGGVAAVEAALALADLAGERARISVVTPEPDLVLKPFVVEEPFTGQPAESHELAPLLKTVGVDVISGALARVDAAARQVELADGGRLGYDALVVCVGGRAHPSYHGAETFWSGSGDLSVNELIERADDSAQGTLALIVPPGTSWPLPLYELALMFRRRAVELGRAELAIRVLTPEDAPLLIFGRPASDSVAELLAARRITVGCGTRVTEEAGGLISHPSGAPVPADVVIALPRIEGPRVAGLPSDGHGFAPVDLHGRVEGLDGVYAAGDGTDFPVKQGGLAAQQADAVAEHLAAKLGAALEPQPFKPVLRGQLLTGGESLQMRQPLTGGQGDGVVSADYLWWPPDKLSGRYLSSMLAHSDIHTLTDPPERPIEVEVSWPHDWHGTPMGYGGWGEKL